MTVTCNATLTVCALTAGFNTTNQCLIRLALVPLLRHLRANVRHSFCTMSSPAVGSKRRREPLPSASPRQSRERSDKPMTVADRILQVVTAIQADIRSLGAVVATVQNDLHNLQAASDTEMVRVYTLTFRCPAYNTFWGLVRSVTCKLLCVSELLCVALGPTLWRQAWPRSPAT